MSETIRIYRRRTVEYEFHDYVDVTQEEYDQIVTKVGVPFYNPESIYLSQRYDEAIYDFIGDEWETDWSEPTIDKVTNVWIDKENK